MLIRILLRGAVLICAPVAVLKAKHQENNAPDPRNERKKNAPSGIVGIMQTAYSYGPCRNNNGKEPHTKDDVKQHEGHRNSIIAAFPCNRSD